jgi:hypothetical protein
LHFIDVADSARPLKDARRPSFIQKIESKAVQFCIHHGHGMQQFDELAGLKVG